MSEFNINKTNKNAFEIRSDVLQLAQSQLVFEYNANFALWQASCKKNEDGTVSYAVQMPDVPGIDKLLDATKKLYDFVTVKAHVK